jgi:site-specific recombinase XerD
MSAHLSLAPLLESFFPGWLTKQRNATPSTIAIYRDALRMLILFIADRTGRKPAALLIDDFDRDLVLAFLDDLEKKRENKIQTRNARLSAIRLFFNHVAANEPASLGIAQRIRAIPVKISHVEVTHHLSQHEVDALIDAPDQQTPRGRRDRALLLFLARTGARVSEAIGVNAADLTLDSPRPQVLLRGKGRKERIVPISFHLCNRLKKFMSERGIALHEPRPLSVGLHETRLTPVGATHIVRRAVATATLVRPDLMRKIVSPHIFHHSLAMKLLQSGVDLLTIQAWLGHSQVATTHRYAAADFEMMRRGGCVGAGDGGSISRARASLALRRQLQSKPRLTWYRAATSVTLRPGSILAATISAFSSADQSRRRRRPVISSTRR